MKTVYVEHISDIKPGQINQLSNFTHKVDVICGELLKLGMWASVSHDSKYGYNYVEVLTNPTHDQIISHLSASHDKGPDSIRIIGDLMVFNLPNYNFDNGILYRTAGRSKCQELYSRIGALAVGESMTVGREVSTRGGFIKYIVENEMIIKVNRGTYFTKVTKLKGVNTVEIKYNAN